MITDSFDKTKDAVINPENIVRKRENFPKVIISTFTSSFTDTVKKRTDKTAGRFFVSEPKEVFVIGDIGYFQCPVGASAAVTAQEQIFELGAEKILYFGSCGILNDISKPYDFIIPNMAYRDEGVSYHYAPPSDYIDIPENKRLMDIFKRFDIPFTEGKIWTTDAFFRETKDNIRKRTDDGIIAVEMECAGLMAAAAFRGKEAFEFLYGADNLTSAYELGALGKIGVSVEEALLDTALKIASEL